MLAKIGQVAYKLEPSEAKIHSVFHVYQLKKHVGHHFTQSHLPMIDDEGLIAKEPVAMLDRRLVNRRGHADKGQICIEFNPIYLVFCVVYHLFWTF